MLFSVLEGELEARDLVIDALKVQINEAGNINYKVNMGRGLTGRVCGCLWGETALYYGNRLCIQVWCLYAHTVYTCNFITFGCKNSLVKERAATYLIQESGK